MTYEDRILERHGMAHCKLAEPAAPPPRVLVKRCRCGRRTSMNKRACLACKNELLRKIAEQEALSRAAASPSGDGTETSTNA